MIARHPVSSPLWGIGGPAWIGFALAGPAAAIALTIAAAAIFVLVAAGRL